MPTVLRVGAFRFFFYTGDRAEPVHIHVQRGGREAKFWLDPIRMERNRGFAARELTRIERLVEQNAPTLIEGWHDYFER